MKRLVFAVMLAVGCLPVFGQSPLRWTRDSVIDLHFRQEFTLLSMQGGLLIVRRRSGEIVQFRYEYERQKT